MNAPAMSTQPDETFIDAVTRLSDVLGRETAALNAHDLAAVRALTDDKTRAAYDYEKAATAFQAWAKGGGAADAGTRDRLRAATALLKRAAADNERRLRAAREAHRQVIELVRGAQQSAAPSTGAYGRGGAVAASRAQRMAAPSLRYQATA